MKKRHASMSQGRLIGLILAGLLVTLVGLITAWLLLRPPVSVTPEASADRPVAVINGVAITPAMVDRELRISRLNVAEPLPPLTGDDLERAREEALNQLLSRQLILQSVAREGFSLSPDFIADRADLLFGSYGEEALDEALVQSGSTRDDLLWWVGELMTVEEFISQVIMAGAAPEDRQAVYNAWLNEQQAAATIEIFENGATQPVLAQVGEPAPNFQLTTLDGRSVSLSDYSGKVVLVNFWATWCPSCLSEMPDYQRVYQQYQPEFIVLGVNLQEGSEHVQSYAAGLGLSFPVLLDSDGVVTNRRYQVTGMPGSFIIDQAGKIYYRHLGPMSAETLMEKLAELGL